MDKVTSLVIALAGCCVLSVAAVSTKGHMYVNNGIYKALTGNITFESTAQSQRECAVQCNQNDSCVTFSFHENTCTGHDAYMSSYSASTPATGARSFARHNDGACERTGVKGLKDTSLGLDTDAFCDGNWLVFQRRHNGSVNFYRNWNAYVTGFGDVHGEYWLGLENLRHITTSGVNYTLRVIVTAFDGTIGTASYSNFYVGPAADNYRLHYGSFLGGNAGDSLRVHRGMQFTTYDADNDKYSSNCAINHGAWWYNKCHKAHLNGVYKKTKIVDVSGINWPAFTSMTHYTLKSCQMMIRPL